MQAGDQEFDCAFDPSILDGVPMLGEATDKRLLVAESEFARALVVADRDGNTLSAIIRQAWDTGDLQVLTKEQIQGTGAHISIIGHITAEELRRKLTETDKANGFANRFLWVCAKRSKLLPDGGNLDGQDLQTIVEQVREAVKFARSAGELRRDEDARELWHEVYPSLSEETPGLLGAVTSRAEAQVMRIALIYALLDCSPVIRKEHLLAALAIWKYCENSARFVFGAALGDPMADEILRVLRQHSDGMTRDEIRNHFGRHKASNQIGRALGVLQRNGLVRMQRENTGGRPSERWFAVGG